MTQRNCCAYRRQYPIDQYPYPYILDKTVIGNAWGSEKLFEYLSSDRSLKMIENFMEYIDTFLSTQSKGTLQGSTYFYTIPLYGFGETEITDMIDFKGSTTTEPQLNGWSYTSGQLTSNKPSHLIWNFTTSYPITKVHITYRSFDHNDYGETVSVSKDNKTWHELFNNDYVGGQDSDKELITDLMDGGTYFLLKIENNTRRHQTLSRLEVMVDLDISIFPRDILSDKSLIEEIDTLNLQKYLFKIFNVEYLLLHEDANWNYVYRRPNDWHSITEFQYYKYFHVLKGVFEPYDFGNLTIVKLNNPERHIYLSDQLAYLDLQEEKIVENNVTLGNNLDLELIVDPSNLEKDRSEMISYKKVDPTFYEINISQQNPEYLIFSSRYDENWILTEGRPSFIEKLIVKPNNTHFKVNLYANGWRVEKPGEYTLYYYPQQAMHAIGGASILSLGLLFLLLKKSTLIKHLKTNE